MNKANLIQLRIVEAESKLKDNYGWTTSMLEELGLDCPTSIDYLTKLDEVIESIEQKEILKEF